MAKKCLKVQKSVLKKAVFYSIGANIRTRRESRCLPYTGFFLAYTYVAQLNYTFLIK